MHTQSYIFGSLMIAAAFLAGAETRAEQGAPRAATAVELIDRFSDTTQLLEGGVAYHSATGVLLVVQGETKEAGRWTTSDEGKVCWELKSSTTQDCTQFVVFQGTIYRSENGHIAGQPDLQAGNMLAEAASARAFENSVELFDPDQTRAFLSGKTAIRSEVGRMYYDPDQTLKTTWNGVRKTGKWSIDDKGGVCWHVVGWGEQPCEYYFNGHNGTVWSRFRGLDKVAVRHVDGDQTQ